MRLLGVVLAGGNSSRFGSDKAVAEIHGEALLDRALANLRAQCETVCIAGRSHPGVQTVADWPEAGMGPLGGLAGALRHGDREGFTHVLSSAVDIPDLPRDLPALLHPAPAYVAEQPVVGLWRIGDLDALETLLTSRTRHSVRAFSKAIGARPVRLERALANINTPRDLDLFAEKGTAGPPSA